MKTILSLFDFTGEWARPFERAGWNVLQMDLKHGDDAGTLTAAWILENICQGYVVDGILAAPPCTDSWQARIFSSRVSKQVSKITLLTTWCARQRAVTAAMSSRTASA